LRFFRVSLFPVYLIFNQNKSENKKGGLLPSLFGN